MTKPKEDWKKKLFEMICAYNRSLKPIGMIDTIMAKRLESFIRKVRQEAREEVVEEIEKRKKQVNRDKHEGSSRGYQKNGSPLYLTKYENGYNQAIDDILKYLKKEKEGG